MQMCTIFDDEEKWSKHNKASLITPGLMLRRSDVAFLSVYQVPKLVGLSFFVLFAIVILLLHLSTRWKSSREYPITDQFLINFIYSCHLASLESIWTKSQLLFIEYYH